MKSTRVSERRSLPVLPQTWAYVGEEPLILTVPEAKDRYYTFEMTDSLGDNFAYVDTQRSEPTSGSTPFAPQSAE